MSSVLPGNAFTVETKSPGAVANLTSTQTSERRPGSPLKTCSGKKERHRLDATKCTFTTTRSTRSDVAKTRRSSRSSSTKVATRENTTANFRWETPSCWSLNSICPRLRSVLHAEERWKKNSVRPAWMFPKPQQPSLKWRKTAKRKWKPLKQNVLLRLKPHEKKRFLNPKKPPSEPCLNYKLVWSAKVHNHPMFRFP